MRDLDRLGWGRRVVAAAMVAAVAGVALGVTAPTAWADGAKRGRSRHFAPERRSARTVRVAEPDPAEAFAFEVLFSVPVAVLAAGVERLADGVRGGRPRGRKEVRPRAGPPPSPPPRPAPPPPSPPAPPPPPAPTLGPAVAGPPMPTDEGAIEPTLPTRPRCWQRCVIYEPAVVEVRGEGQSAETVVVRLATIREVFEPVGPDGTPLR